MSAKLPQRSNKKKPDLHHKQVGCMNGLFHFFDCHHFLGGRRIGGQNHKRLLPVPGQNANHETVHQNTTEKPKEKIQEEVTEEEKKQSVLTESSATSHPSAECNTTPQQEPSPPAQSSFLKTPPPISLKRQPNSSTATGERVSNVMKHIDSPRPLPISKFMKPKVPALDGSFRPKDAPRFSYDERESQNKRKSSVKLKEIPRLSLDSRESSIRRSAYQPRSNVVSADLQEPGSNKRPSSVVAKLMGLEDLPDSTSANNKQVLKMNSFQDKEIDATSRKTDESNHNLPSRSPRTPQKELPSLQLRNKSSRTKANSRVALEPAPWRHKDGNRAIRKPDRNKKEEVLPSVYGAIEKRLTELEFKRSGKDLRALKQILEAMQKTREKVENNKDGENSTSAMEFSSPKTFKSSIVIIKPARVVQKPTESAKLNEGLSGLQSHRTSEMEKSKTRQITQPTDKIIIGRTDRSTKPLRAVQHAGSESGSTATSPRLHQKKHRMESQTRSAVTPATDSRGSRRYISNKQTESGSPKRKLKPKSPRLKPSCEIGKDTEVTNLDSSRDINRTFPGKDQINEVTATVEQPSPSSVLDASFYAEESPSPVKKISNAFTGEEILHLDDAQWNLEDLDSWVNMGRPNTKADFHQDKYETVKHIQKLREVNTTYISPCALTNPDHLYIKEIMSTSGFLNSLSSRSTFIQLHPSGHLINPNLFLVLEQTKGSMEVSEDAQGDEKVKQSKYRGKLHRKLIFDMVDEILTRELTSAGFTEPWISPNKLGVRNLTGQKLLKELCSEIDHLLRKPDKSSSLDLDYEDALTSIIRDDTMNRKQKWEDYQPEIPGIVLEIERLIFKDLVREIMNAEVHFFPGRSTKPCRQLFLQ